MCKRGIKTCSFWQMGVNVFVKISYFPKWVLLVVNSWMDGLVIYIYNHVLSVSTKKQLWLFCLCNYLLIPWIFSLNRVM